MVDSFLEPVLRVHPETLWKEYPRELLISECDRGHLSMYFAPFDHVNVQARLVLVGLTPGRYQAVRSIEEFQRSYALDGDIEKALKVAKEIASFSGPMRTNLIKMLDHVGLNTALGLQSCAELFSSSRHLVHYTSLLRYPTFVKGRNYSGTPSPIANSWLQQAVVDHFSPELQALPQRPLIVPLGSRVDKSLQSIAGGNLRIQKHLLSGLPHPSGANAERIAYFLNKKDKELLSRQTNPDEIDQSRENLMKIIRTAHIPQNETQGA